MWESHRGGARPGPSSGGRAITSSRSEGDKSRKMLAEHRGRELSKESCLEVKWL